MFNLHWYMHSIRTKFGDCNITHSISFCSQYCDNIPMNTGSTRRPIGSIILLPPTWSSIHYVSKLKVSCTRTMEVHLDSLGPSCILSSSRVAYHNLFTRIRGLHHHMVILIKIVLKLNSSPTISTISPEPSYLTRTELCFAIAIF